MIIQAIIVEEERNRPESALISNLGQLWTFDRNPFGISGIEHATFCGTKPELRPDQPVSPRITARQEIVSSKRGVRFNGLTTQERFLRVFRATTPALPEDCVRIEHNVHAPPK